jgi:hypothetical protein
MSETTFGARAKTRLDSRSDLCRLPTGLQLHLYYETGTFTSGELQVECGV